MKDGIDKQVQKRVKAKKGFLIHFGVYLATGLFFLFMNIATFQQEGEWWFYYPMIAWGLGIMIHYIGAFGFPGSRQLIEKWEIEETAREMRKQREMEAKALPEANEPDEELDLPPLKRQKDKLYDDRDLV